MRKKQPLTQQSIQCQKHKFGKHTKSPIDKSQGFDGRFTHLHIDIVGSLPNVCDLTYRLTIEDRFSRWPGVILTLNNFAEIIAKVVLGNWISIFGVASVFTTDRGSLDVKQIRTIAYNPCVNGIVESFHKQLKTEISTKIDL